MIQFFKEKKHEKYKYKYLRNHICYMIFIGRGNIFLLKKIHLD